MAWHSFLTLGIFAVVAFYGFPMMTCWYTAHVGQAQNCRGEKLDHRPGGWIGIYNRQHCMTATHIAFFDHDIWRVVSGFKAMPIILHPLIFFGKLSKMSDFAILLAILVGRIIKYSSWAETAA